MITVIRARIRHGLHKRSRFRSRHLGSPIKRSAPNYLLAPRLGLGLQGAKRVAHRAEVRGVLRFQYECQCAMGIDLHDVYRHGLALSSLDISQRVWKVSAEACSVLSIWSWLCGLSRPQCHHGTSVTVSAAAVCWLVGWRQERPSACDTLNKV
jgi:hypothetical protein